MRKLALPVVALAALFGVAGCSAPEKTADAPKTEAPVADVKTSEAPVGQPDPSTAPTTPALVGGEYFFTNNGAVAKFNTTSAPVADIEKVRALAGVPAVKYLVVKVDNRKGTEAVLPTEIRIIGKDGVAIGYDSAGSAIDDWRQLDPDVANDTTKYNEFINTGNKYLHGVPVGEVGQLVFLTPGAKPLPAEFGSVKIYQGKLNEPWDAYPVEAIKVMGANVDLNF